MKAKKIRRLDPPNCGCTDCICPNGNGDYYSQPVDTVDTKVVARMLNGKIMNATAYPYSAYLVVRDGDGKLRGIIMPWKADDFWDRVGYLA